MKKVLTPIVLCMITGLLFGFLVQSCKTNKTVAKPVFTPIGVLVVNSKKDTVAKLPPKRTMTAEQLQAYLLPFYRANFDKLFAPEFTRLNNVIITQAKSLDKITTILTTTRKRTDSIVRERNYYKEGYIRFQKQTLDYQKQSLKYQEQLLKIQNDNFTKNDKQIKANQWLATGCMIGVIILGISILILYLQVRSLSKKFDGHFRKTAHV